MFTKEKMDLKRIAAITNAGAISGSERPVTRLMKEALEGYAWGLGAAEVTVHASRTARPFFERRGYRVVKAQQVERRGVLLENFAMAKKWE